MKGFIKNYWKTLLFFAVVGLLGGFFTGIYMLDSYPEDLKQQALEQGLNDTLIGVVTAVQSAGYGIILGGIGIRLGKKTGLWKDEKSIEKKPLLTAIVIAVVGGLAMILPDVTFFGKYSEAIANSYQSKPTLVYMLASVTYGAVIEEVMLRLFTTSLIAFVLQKLFEKGNEVPSVKLLIISNIISAVLFSVGHLPATFILLGNSSLIIARCLLLNGGIGLSFGYLYRKFGLRYAMIAHGGCHIISKLIWILFI